MGRLHRAHGAAVGLAEYRFVPDPAAWCGSERAMNHTGNRDFRPGGADGGIGSRGPVRKIQCRSAGWFVHASHAAMMGTSLSLLCPSYALGE